MDGKILENTDLTLKKQLCKSVDNQTSMPSGQKVVEGQDTEEEEDKLNDGILKEDTERFSLPGREGKINEILIFKKGEVLFTSSSLGPG